MIKTPFCLKIQSWTIEKLFEKKTPSKTMQNKPQLPKGAHAMTNSLMHNTSREDLYNLSQVDRHF